MKELYTKLYVEIYNTLEELLQMVADVLVGNIDMTTIETNLIEVDVIHNEFASKVTEPDDFISYAYTVEVVNVVEMPLNVYIDLTSDIMNHLNENNAKVVAACDWEDQLPGGGKLGLS
jgi:hypothetical protein